MEKAIYTTQHNTVVEKIISARNEAGLTQKQLAEKLGRTQSFISKVESGQRRVDVVLVKQLSKLLKKPISYFVSES